MPIAGITEESNETLLSLVKKMFFSEDEHPAYKFWLYCMSIKNRLDSNQVSFANSRAADNPLDEKVEDARAFAWISLHVQAYLAVGDSGVKRVFTAFQKNAVLPLWFVELTKTESNA